MTYALAFLRLSCPSISIRLTHTRNNFVSFLLTGTDALKPLGLSVDLAAGGSINYSATVTYHACEQVDLGISFYRSVALVEYTAFGFTVSSRYYLPPVSQFMQFVSLGLGPIWKDELSSNVLSGALCSAQFGWDLISPSGFNGSLAVGPILAFLKDEKVSGAIIQLRIGWRF